MSQSPSPKYDPAQLQQLRRFTVSREGPYGKLSNAVPRMFFEEPEPLQSLDPDWVWIAPGLLYSLVGLDRSIFAMFFEARGSTAELKTARAQAPLFVHENASNSADPRVCLIQGIHKDLAAEFLAYVQSFEFHAGSKIWRINPTAVRIADPFVASSKRGADTVLLLPELVSHGRRVVVVREPGLLLLPAVLGVRDA